MPETPEPARAVPPPADLAHLAMPPQSRFVIERSADGGGRAVYEVLDKSRHPKRRVICRTNLADAKMIVAGLVRENTDAMIKAAEKEIWDWQYDLAQNEILPSELANRIYRAMDAAR